jgi:hypothetical protein
MKKEKERLTRLDLFTKLFNGELKDGDKFVDEQGDVAVVRTDKVFDVQEIVWEQSGGTLMLYRFLDKEEYFTPLN